MRLARHIAPLLAALLLAAGCDHLNTVFSRGFIVRAASAALILRNDTADPVHYAAFDSGSPIGLTLMPGEFWPSIAPGAEVTVPYSALNAESRPHAVRILWWTHGQYQSEINLDVP